MPLCYRFLHLCASARVINDAERIVNCNWAIFELLIARGGREEFRSDRIVACSGDLV